MNPLAFLGIAAIAAIAYAFKGGKKKVPEVVEASPGEPAAEVSPDVAQEVSQEAEKQSRPKPRVRQKQTSYLTPVPAPAGQAVVPDYVPMNTAVPSPSATIVPSDTGKETELKPGQSWGLEGPTIITPPNMAALPTDSSMRPVASTQNVHVQKPQETYSLSAKKPSPNVVKTPGPKAQPIVQVVPKEKVVPRQFLDRALVPKGPKPLALAKIRTARDALNYASAGFHAVLDIVDKLPRNAPIERYSFAAKAYQEAAVRAATQIKNGQNDWASLVVMLTNANRLMDAARKEKR